MNGREACVPAVSVQAEHHHVGVFCKYLLSALAVVDVPAGITKWSRTVITVVPQNPEPPDGDR
jgi:hypothetical protein